MVAANSCLSFLPCGEPTLFSTFTSSRFPLLRNTFAANAHRHITSNLLASTTWGPADLFSCQASHAPSAATIAGLADPCEKCEDSIGLKLLTKARYSLAKFKEEQTVVLPQVLANDVNIGYGDMSNLQVFKFNGVSVRNIHHLAHLVDTCKDTYLVFEFEDKCLAIMEREAASAASTKALQDSEIPAQRSADLLQPYLDSFQNEQGEIDAENEDTAVTNMEIGFDGLQWAGLFAKSAVFLK